MWPLPIVCFLFAFVAVDRRGLPRFTNHSIRLSVGYIIVPLTCWKLSFRKKTKNGCALTSARILMMSRNSEYRSSYIGPMRLPLASPRVNTGRIVAPAAGANLHHLRKSRMDMIPATAVAIPTAQTHRSPKRTTYSRTTYTIVRTPNVSAVHHDPYAAVPSVDASCAYRRSSAHQQQTAARSVPQRSRSTAASSAVSQQRRERQLLTKVDIMEAKNRDLENRLLDLTREMMMMKAGNGRLHASRERSDSSGRAQRSTAEMADNRRLSAARRCNSTNTSTARHYPVMSPPGRRRSAQQEAPNVASERTLHLVDELRDALLHQTSFATEGRNNSSQQRIAVKRKTVKKRKASCTSAPIDSAAGQLRAAIEKESARYARGDWPADEYEKQHRNISGRGVLRSPARPLQAQHRGSTIPRHAFDRDDTPIPSAYEDDEAFESLQRSYWTQSQHILEELDRKLRSMDVTRTH